MPETAVPRTKEEFLAELIYGRDSSAAGSAEQAINWIWFLIETARAEWPPPLPASEPIPDGACVLVGDDEGGYWIHDMKSGYLPRTAARVWVLPPRRPPEPTLEDRAVAAMRRAWQAEVGAMFDACMTICRKLAARGAPGPKS
jgi:hypothetical protein